MEKMKNERNKKMVVSVPYRGCFVFNDDGMLFCCIDCLAFPSPIGDVLFLIWNQYDDEEEYTICKFPSPIGDVLFLIAQGRNCYVKN